MTKRIRKLITRARDQVSRGRLRDAATLLDEAFQRLDERWDNRREHELLLADIRRWRGKIADLSGDYPRAFVGFAGALELRSRHFPPNNLDILHLRHDVAEIMRVAGENTRALAEFDEVLAHLRADSPVRDRKLLALTLKHRAYALLDLHRPGEAEHTLTEALDLVDNQRDRVDVLGALARTRRSQGLDLDLAPLHYGLRELISSPSPEISLWATIELAHDAPPREGVAMLSEAIARLDGELRGELPAMVAVSWSNMGAALITLDSPERALDAFLNAARVMETVLATTIRVGPTIDRSTRQPWAVVPPVIALLDHVGDEQRARAVPAAYRAAAGWKCVQAEVLRARAALAVDDDSNVTGVLRDARAHRAESAISAAYADLLDSALAMAVPADVVEQCFTRSDTAAVTDRLPYQGALVEFVRVDACRVDGEAPLPNAADPYYVAFVVLPEPVMVRLGDAAPIDAAVAKLSAAIPVDGTRHIRPAAKPFTDWRTAAAALAELIWWPLRSALGDCTEVVLAPDAELCAVPFDLLPDGPDGPPLLATRTTSLVATGRDLVRLAERPNAVAGDPVVIAAPDYGPPHTPYTPLTGALREGRAVADLLGVPLISGAAASRDLVSRSSRPEILHIASHGFAHLSEDTASPRDLLRSSGIALADANAGEVLTALDVLDLDLVGTDLVVLSACDSGLGPIGAGEGLLSLARSFFLSGARTVVWSLWKVDDEITADLMTDYYQRLLSGVRRVRALADAKRILYRRHPDRPQLWSSFVSQGDAGGLGRFRFIPVPEQSWKRTESDYTDFPGITIDSSRIDSTHTLYMPGDTKPFTYASISARYVIGMAEDDLHRAELAFEAGRLAEAVEHARKALGLGGLVPDRVHAMAHARLTIFTAMLGELSTAVEHGRESVRRFEELRLFPDRVAAALDNLGTVQARLGNLDTALELWERALAIKLDHLPLDQAEVELTERNIAEVQEYIASIA